MVPEDCLTQNEGYSYGKGIHIELINNIVLFVFDF